MTWNVCNLGLFPYRLLSCVVPLVTFFATLFFLLAAFRCSFSVSKGDGEDGMFVGLFSHERLDSSTDGDRHVCVPWDEDSKKELFDPKWRFGRVMAVIGVFSCLAVATLNFVLIYMRFPTTWYFQIVLAHLGNALICCLLLIAKSSSVCRSEGNKCVLGKTGYLGIVAGILWVVAAFLYMLVRRLELKIREEVLASDSDEENPRNRALPPPPSPSFLPPFMRKLLRRESSKNLLEASESPRRSPKQKISKSAGLPPFDTVVDESENDSANRNSEDSGPRTKQGHTKSRDPKSPRAWKKNPNQQEGMSSPRTQRNEIPNRKNSNKPRRGMPR